MRMEKKRNECHPNSALSLCPSTKTIFFPSLGRERRKKKTSFIFSFANKNENEIIMRNENKCIYCTAYSVFNVPLVHIEGGKNNK